MRSFTHAVLTLALLVTFAGHATAGGKDKAAPGKGREVATFSVPRVSDLALLKQIVKAVSGRRGVVSAQADSGRKTLAVVFERKAIAPEALLKSIQTVADDATLLGVTPSAAASGCGGCPSATSCPSARP
jgi:hypothetical protein